MLLLPCQVLYDIKSGPGEGLQGFIAIVVHVDLLADPAETEMVGDYKGVYPIVLGQVRVGFLELPDLLGVEYMEFPLIPAQPPVLAERVDQAVPVDGCGLQADHHIVEPHSLHC